MRIDVELAEPVNPYFAGNPLSGEEVFYGRGEVFRRIRQQLARAAELGRTDDSAPVTGRKAVQQKSIVLSGQPRSGKTSLLYQLNRKLDQGYYHCVYINLGDLNLNGIDNLLREVAATVSRELEHDLRITVNVPEIEDFRNDAYDAFEPRFITDVLKALNDKCLVFMIDEVNLLAQKVAAGQLSEGIFAYLRHLAADYNRLYFVFSLRGSFHDSVRDYADMLDGSLYYPISFLEDITARELITGPIASYYRLTPQAVRRILQATSGHPYYTQLICNCLFEFWRNAPKNLLDLADVNAVLSEATALAYGNLSYVWDTAATPERVALAGLAAVVADGQSAATTGQVWGAWQGVDVDLPEREIEQALETLTARDVLLRGTGYSFAVELQRLWIGRHHPLSRAELELADSIRPWPDSGVASRTRAGTGSVADEKAPAARPKLLWLCPFRLATVPPPDLSDKVEFVVSHETADAAQMLSGQAEPYFPVAVVDTSPAVGHGYDPIDIMSQLAEKCATPPRYIVAVVKDGLDMDPVDSQIAFALEIQRLWGRSRPVLVIEEAILYYLEQKSPVPVKSEYKSSSILQMRRWEAIARQAAKLATSELDVRESPFSRLTEAFVTGMCAEPHASAAPRFSASQRNLLFELATRSLGVRELADKLRFDPNYVRRLQSQIAQEIAPFLEFPHGGDRRPDHAALCAELARSYAPWLRSRRRRADGEP